MAVKKKKPLLLAEIGLERTSKHVAEVDFGNSWRDFPVA
jgi:hypothetical protein